jgi:hypothetical protein
VKLNLRANAKIHPVGQLRCAQPGATSSIGAKPSMSAVPTESRTSCRLASYPGSAQAAARSHHNRAAGDQPVRIVFGDHGNGLANVDRAVRIFRAPGLAWREAGRAPAASERTRAEDTGRKRPGRNAARGPARRRLPGWASVSTAPRPAGRKAAAHDTALSRSAEEVTPRPNHQRHHTAQPARCPGRTGHPMAHRSAGHRRITPFLPGGRRSGGLRYCAASAGCRLGDPTRSPRMAAGKRVRSASTSDRRTPSH